MKPHREQNLATRDRRPKCGWCQKGRLDLTEKRPDPVFGALGMTLKTFKCDAPECGKLTIR
jgi:hypothetical protein